MPQIPRVNAKDIINILEQAGFKLARQSGSHKIYKNAVGRRVTVPFHGSKILHPKTLKSILKEADMTVTELINQLKS